MTKIAGLEALGDTLRELTLRSSLIGRMEGLTTLAGALFVRVYVGVHLLSWVRCMYMYVDERISVAN